jgi:hypothetical protein
MHEGFGSEAFVVPKNGRFSDDQTDVVGVNQGLSGGDGEHRKPLSAPNSLVLESISSDHQNVPMELDNLGFSRSLLTTHSAPVGKQPWKLDSHVAPSICERLPKALSTPVHTKTRQSGANKVANQTACPLGPPHSTLEKEGSALHLEEGQQALLLPETRHSPRILGASNESAGLHRPSSAGTHQAEEWLSKRSQGLATEQVDLNTTWTPQQIAHAERCQEDRTAGMDAHQIFETASRLRSLETTCPAPELDLQQPTKAMKIIGDYSTPAELKDNTFGAKDGHMGPDFAGRHAQQEELSTYACHERDAHDSGNRLLQVDPEGNNNTEPFQGVCEACSPVDVLQEHEGKGFSLIQIAPNNPMIVGSCESNSSGSTSCSSDTRALKLVKASQTKRRTQRHYCNACLQHLHQEQQEKRPAPPAPWPIHEHGMLQCLA